MSVPRIDRRDFLKAAGAVAAAWGTSGPRVLGAEQPRPAQTVLPRWKGFNLLDFFSPNPSRGPNRDATTEDDLRWMSDWGFDFVRIPMAYPRWIDFDRSKPIRPEDMTRIKQSTVDEVDALVAMAHKHGLHVSLNMHRAPGYCVNAGFQEPFNLWKDPAALEAFCFQWDLWARRYKDLRPAQISFDLVNEPSMREDMNDQHSPRGPVPGDVYRRVAAAAAKAIRIANPNHLVIADGNQTGNTVIPEIVDLNIAQSCRGYHPGIISHYKAPWAFKDVESLPGPVYPGKTGDETWDQTKLRDYYAPWIDLARKGVGVHCGECGCWKMTPHPVFLAWFGDVLDILTSNGIGYALWNFRGDFGILDSGRLDVAYEDWHGHKLDRKLLDLLRAH